MPFSEAYAAACSVKMLDWLEKNATENPWHYAGRQIARETGISTAYIKPVLTRPEIAEKYDILQTRLSRRGGGSTCGSQWRIRKR